MEEGDWDGKEFKDKRKRTLGETGAINLPERGLSGSRGHNRPVSEGLSHPWGSTQTSVSPEARIETERRKTSSRRFGFLGVSVLTTCEIPSVPESSLFDSALSTVKILERPRFACLIRYCPNWLEPFNPRTVVFLFTRNFAKGPVIRTH